MTVRWTPLGEGELDHELLWGWLAVLGAVAAAVWLSVPGVPPFACPLRSMTGIPCPTCGTTRALVALLAGDLRTSVGLHPFVAPAVLAVAVYVPYALTVCALRLRRMRIEIGPHDGPVARSTAIAAGIAVWCYLIVAGR